MTDTTLAAATFVVALVALAVLASSRITARIGLPLPALVLAGAAAVVALVPSVHPPSREGVQRLVSVALVAVLFSGGMGLGVRRVRRLLVPIGAVGVVGTFATAAAGAVAVHLIVGSSWYASALVATALAPTDPTVVFSVLGRRRIAGGSGTVLEAESGANDPVGIALMVALVGAHGLSVAGAGHVAGTFALQMAVGLAVGAGGGRLLGLLMRRVPLPSEGLYPLRPLAGAYALYGAASLMHGSGFLAVFVAGIAIGDVSAPFDREVRRFVDALASLGESVAFVALGLTVDIAAVARPDVWGPGLALAAVSALVVRPLAVGPLLATAPLRRHEAAFVGLTGLKGAVPILLAGDLFAAHLADTPRLYGIVVVAVVASVVVQGGAVGFLARRLGLSITLVDPQPWAVGVRLPERPDDVVRVVVGAGAPADGAAVGELAGLPDGATVSLLLRADRLVAVRADTRLRAGDDLTVVGVDPEHVDAVRAVVAGATGPSPGR